MDIPFVFKDCLLCIVQIQNGLYKICEMAAQSFFSYEETVPLLRSCYFPDFTIHKREDVAALISCLPDDPHAEMPQHMILFRSKEKLELEGL